MAEINSRETVLGPEFDAFDPGSHSFCGGEPYSLEDDTGWGQCHECNSYLENAGAVSDGDGSIFDELWCPLCQERRGKANETWYDENEEFDDEKDEPCFHPNMTH